MSERGSSYDSFAILSNASPTDDMSVEEYSALIEFQGIAKKIEVEQEKTNSLISFLNSQQSQNIPQPIKDFTQHQIDESNEIITNLYNQARGLQRSEILIKLAHKLQLKKVRMEMNAEAEKEFEKLKEEWRRKRAIAEASYIRQLEQTKNSASPTVQRINQSQPTLSKTTTEQESKDNGSDGNGVLIFFVIMAAFISIILLILFTRQSTSDTKPAISESHAVTESSTTLPPTTAATKPVPKPQSRPTSGTISINTVSTEEIASEITVHTSSQDCVVKLKTSSGKTVLSFFVRANDTVTIGVPARVLYAYFAQGDTWYGWSSYFGESTVYSKDSSPTDFSNYTIEYTLYRVSNGNLSLTPVDEDDF